jgi:sugar O-acyltransferase (sialic acid O-acetyltransferase NeuD family)
MADGRDFVLWGSAGHARVLADIIRGQGGRLVALVDNNPAATTIADGIPLLHGEGGLREWLHGRSASGLQALVAIGGGHGADRLQLQRLLSGLGFGIPSLRHASAVVAPDAVVGAGSQLLASSILAAGAAIGEACILNHKVSVDHETRLGAGVHLAPGVTVCGCTEIGDQVFVGAGACILPRLRIGSNTIVGAGSLVTCDLPAGVVAFGHPARVIRAITDAAGSRPGQP